MRAFFFFVFLDMRYHPTAWHQGSPRALRRRPVQAASLVSVQASRSSIGQVLITRSTGTALCAAFSQPCGCHSSCPVAWASESIEMKQP